MPMILTYGALLLVIGAAILLRVRWSRLSPLLRSRLLLLALCLAFPVAINQLTKWETTSVLLDELLAWVRIAGYILLVVFFTRLRPRWLTAVIAVVLLLPIFASSFAAPLSDLFNPRPFQHTRFADDYVLETARWTSGAGENSGVDFTLLYQPSRQSIFRRGFRAGRLYDSQCQTSDAFATFDPVRAAITVHCPPRPLANSSGLVDPNNPGTTLFFPLH